MGDHLYHITLCLDALIAVPICTFHCAKTLYSTQILETQKPCGQNPGTAFLCSLLWDISICIETSMRIYSYSHFYLWLACTVYLWWFCHHHNDYCNPGIIYWSLIIVITHIFFHSDFLACCQIYHHGPVILAENWKMIQFLNHTEDIFGLCSTSFVCIYSNMSHGLWMAWVLSGWSYKQCSHAIVEPQTIFITQSFYMNVATTFAYNMCYHPCAWVLVLDWYYGAWRY